MAAARDEQREMAELRAMFAAPGSPDRGSSLPVGSMSRLLTQIDNRSEADAIRKDREERQRLKAEADEARARAIAAHKQAEKERLEQAKAPRAVMERQKRDAKRQQRELEAIWENERNERDRTYFEQSREKVLHDKAMDAKMDKAEAAVDEAERILHATEKKELQKKFATERSNGMAVRRKQAEERRQATIAQQELKRQQAEARRREVAERAKQLALANATSKQENEARHRQHVQQKTLGISTGRHRVKAAKQAVLEERRAGARKERSNDHLVEEEKQRVLAQKRAVREQVYKRSFATARDAKKLEATLNSDSSFYLLNRAAGQPDPGIR